MTIRQKLEDYLYQRGMFPNQAKAVVDALISNSDKSMEGRWDDEVEGYPPSLLAVLGMGLQHEALRWIDANCPQAWYRSLFTEVTK